MFEPSPQPPPAAPQPPIAPTPPAVEGQAWRLIAQVRGAQRRALWAQGLFFGGAAFLLLVLLAGLVGAAHPTAAQWLLVIAVLAPTALVIGLGVGVSSRRVGDELRTARHLAAKVPELKLDLLAAAELSRALGQRHDFSVGLAQAFIRDVDLRASRLSVRALIDRRPMEWAAAFLALVCIASMGTLAWKGAKVRAGLLAAVSSHATIPPGLKREPITGDIELSYRYPAHTGLEARTVTGTAGDIVGPTGTEVTVHTRADRDVEGAALVVNGKQVPLTTKGRELTGSLLLEKSGQYHFLFLDGSKVVAEGPDLPVQVEADQLPQVRITAPIEVLELDPDKQQVLIKYEVTDDYGVSGLELVHRAAGQEEKRITLKPDEGRTTRGQYTWNLADLRLKPGQAVSYSLEAKDNDAVSGPKKGVSRTQTVKLYSAAEHRREALKKAEALWERLVTHTADRLEGHDRATPLTPEGQVAAKAVDQKAVELAEGLGGFAADLDKERDPPLELLAASRNISVELGRDTSAVSAQRRLYARFEKTSSTATRDLSVRLVAVVGQDVEHSEKNVLYLEALLDRQRLEALKQLAEELKSERRELSHLLEEYQQTKDEKTQAALLQAMQELRTQMMELQQRMAELARGIREEHLNREALQEMMEEQDLGSRLDEVEKLVREGKADEALKKMQELAMQMDQFLEQLDTASDQAEADANPELAKAFQEFQQNVEETTKAQEGVADKTKALRDKYRAQAKERVEQRGGALKKELEAHLEELKKDYEGLNSEPNGPRMEQPRLEALQNVDHTRQALQANDFDLAADAADKLAQKANQLAQHAEELRRTDELFQTPPEVKKQSRALQEKLAKDARKAEDVAQKLHGLFQGQPMSQPDQQQLGDLKGQQQQLEQRAQQLQQQMNDISEKAPIFDEEAKQQLEQAGQRMGAAGERLGGKDPSRGYSEQQGALQSLRGLQQQMQQMQQGGQGGKRMPMPMRSRRGNGRGGVDQEKVAIPDEDPNQAPRDFRRDVMDAMKQGAPDRYRDQNKRYYEELVK